MSVDTTKIGVNTSELMDTLGNAYEDDDTAVVTEVITIAVVRTDRRPVSWEPLEPGEDEPDGYSFVHYRATEVAWHRQLGLIEAAKLAVNNG